MAALYGVALYPSSSTTTLRGRAQPQVKQTCNKLLFILVYLRLYPTQEVEGFCLASLNRKRRLWGHWVYIAAFRLEGSSLLVVAPQSAPKSAIPNYAKRWSIETLFGIFKTCGFCLELTHLTDLERLSKLLALLSLALCWVSLTGQWLHELKPLTIKQHRRRAKSIFRYGFDRLRHIVLNLEQKMDDFRDVLQFLS
ncbi:hypothetical protein IFO70_26835 [Phormidium tenue FACHB-886]|nr:hypothetical protein [Phormidium tenue FACHB-886]